MVEQVRTPRIHIAGNPKTVPAYSPAGRLAGAAAVTGK